MRPRRWTWLSASASASIAPTCARRRASCDSPDGSNEQVLREMLELCASVCDECAAECEKHDHEHCKLCAQMCRECAEDCRVGGGIALEVGLPEARNALVAAGRVQHGDIELERLADPVAEFGMVGEIVVGQRMDQRAQA